MEAWKFAMQPVKVVYQMTSDFPTEERYGLAPQRRGAAVSFPAILPKAPAETAQRNICISSVLPADHSQRWKPIYNVR